MTAAPGAGSAGGIVVVLSGYPRRSETFALAELAALARAGRLQRVFATKPGDGLAPHDDAARLAHLVTWLPDGESAAQAQALAGALHGERPIAIHGYFAHRPADVAQGAAARLGVPFGFSVHARDARKVAPGVLRDRARRAACVVTCNEDAHASLRAIGVASRLIPHGVNLDRFSGAPWRPGTPLRVLAVGRLVPKKGFDVLLRALARVTAPWRLRIVGDGPERGALEMLALELGIAAGVDWYGPATHGELPGLYREAHVVAVPSVVDRTGDRDGLPNVVLEALASGRVVVATRAGAIASAVRDAETGWLVDAGDVGSLADRLERVTREPETAARLAAAGRAFVSSEFEGGRCARRFVEALEASYA